MLFFNIPVVPCSVITIIQYDFLQPEPFVARNDVSGLFRVYYTFLAFSEFEQLAAVAMMMKKPNSIFNNNQLEFSH